MNRFPATSGVSCYSHHLPAAGEQCWIWTVLLRMPRLAGLHAAPHSRPPYSALERLQQVQHFPSGC